MDSSQPRQEQTDRATAGHTLRGTVLVIAAATLWGFNGTVAKAIFNRAIDPLILVEARLILASLVMLVFLLISNRRGLLIRRADIGYFAILGAGLAAVQASYFFAIAETNVSVAVFLQYLSPVLIAAYAGITGRDRVTVRLCLAIAVATVGGLLMVIGGGGLAHFSARGVASGLLAAFCLAFYTVYGRRGTQRYGAPTALFYAMAFGAAFWSLVIHPGRALHAGLATDTLLFYLYIAIFGTAMPFTLYFAGLRYLPATRTGTIATLEPVMAAVTAWVFLGESLRLVQIIGAAMVAAAVVAASERLPGRGPSGRVRSAAE
ncbi:MAG: EamA family transporter [Chloroflexota bacterium]